MTFLFIAIAAVACMVIFYPASQRAEAERLQKEERERERAQASERERERRLAQFVMRPNRDIRWSHGKWSLCCLSPTLDWIDTKDIDVAVAAWVASHPEEATRLKAEGEVRIAEMHAARKARAAREAAEIESEAPALATLRAMGLRPSL